MQEGGIAKVQNSLTLLLTLKVPPGQTSRKETYNLVKQTFDTPELQQSLIDGLNNVGTVHFARFFFLDKQADKAGNVWYNKMALITSYDGELRRYIKDAAALHKRFRQGYRSLVRRALSIHGRH